MNKTTTTKEQFCIFCGALADTVDHVPPKFLFTAENISTYKFRTVPACKACNNSFSKDEEFFRLMICTASFDHSSDAAMMYLSKIQRSLKRSPKLLARHLSSLALVEMLTKHGIYTGGKKTKFTISVEDWKRHHGVVEKISRGIFFLENGWPPPKDLVVKHVILDDKQMKEQLPHLKTLRFNFHPVFTTGFGNVPGSSNSVVLTIFYGHFVFLTFMIEPADVETVTSMNKLSEAKK